MDFVVYAICFGTGLLFTLVTAALGHVFGGLDGHGGDVGTGGEVDAGFDHSGLPGPSILSPTSLACFLTAFGAFGMIFSRVEVTSSAWLSAPLAVVGGILVAGAVLWVLTLVFQKTQASSESKVGDLVGRAATIITPIPADGVGEIAYVDGGSRYNAPARSEGGKPVPGGEKVYITRIIGTQFYVTPQ
ncbi:MAG: NfeD family protein [Verrucomicrobiales bacterium]|nr:NfeD family protein [Verrucomicrobiales bacterium]